MNILVATQRQSALESNWALIGTKFLLEKKFKCPINWVTFDVDSNPYNSSFPNQFHHQTLLPFSAVVFSGLQNWRSPKLQPIYSLLERSDVPLIAFGLAIEKNIKGLTSLEEAVFSKPDTTVISKDVSTQEYFARYGLITSVLPCPSIFAGFHPEDTNSNKLSFVLADNIHRADQELVIAKILESLMDLCTKYEIDILTTSTNSFMRFSTMFRNKVRYSYDSADYLPWIKSSKLLVTTNLSMASLATSMGRPALLTEELLSLSEKAQLSQYPLIQTTVASDISKRVTRVMGTSPSHEKYIVWKRESLTRWEKVLQKNTLRIPL